MGAFVVVGGLVKIGGIFVDGPYSDINSCG